MPSPHLLSPRVSLGLAVVCLAGLLGCPGADLLSAAPVLTPGVDETTLSRQELLGKRLFEDTRLSEPPGQACGSCHAATSAFTGTAGSSVAAVARGSTPDKLGNRNVPTLAYASFSPDFQFVLDDLALVPMGGQFWDGRAVDLAAQAQGPFLNPREMNNPDAASVIAKLVTGPYATLFNELCGDGADTTSAYGCVGEAIAAFERTSRFHPFSSRFDRYLTGQGQLSSDEARGFELFKDPNKGNCIACHVGTVGSRDPQDWLFTDFTYDALGAPRNRAIPDNADPTSFDLGLCKQPGLASRAPATFKLERSCGAFKVPTLRNIALTGPYFHNGAIAELRDVLSFYVTRDTNPERWYPAASDGGVLKFDDLPPEYRANVNTTEVPYDLKPGEPPRMTEDELDALLAFLKTLTDE